MLPVTQKMQYGYLAAEKVT